MQMRSSGSSIRDGVYVLAAVVAVSSLVASGCDWISGTSYGPQGEPPRADAVQPEPCVFGPNADAKAVEAVVRDWAAKNQLGAVKEWGISVDKARADLAVDLGDDRLQVSWQLTADCGTGAIDAKRRNTANPVPSESALRALVEKLPLATVIPKTGEHPAASS